MMGGCALRVGGITPLTTLDYPHHLACVLFCQGCPWRCSYCQNEHLIPANSPDAMPWRDIESFLMSRKNLLEAVVFSGGEPTAQPAVIAAAAHVRELGFKVGVHTGGSYPERLSLLLNYCNWVALDVKTGDDDYAALTGAANAAQMVSKSLDCILKSRITYEVRTTVHWDLLAPAKLLALAKKLAARGVEHYALQLCLTRQGLAKKLPPSIFSEADNQFIGQDIAPLFSSFELRNV